MHTLSQTKFLDREEFVMSGNDKAVQLDERFDAGEPVPTDQLVMRNINVVTSFLLIVGSRV